MATLTTNETTALTFMAEEEKLAFEVYTTLASKWDLKIFTNIATNSETKHISSVETLADQYGIATPDLAFGVYESPELQALYDNLVAIGSRSITDALKVGIVVEVVDIEDLTNYLADTTNTDLTTTFTKLLTDSEKHLSAFTKTLEKYDQTLTAEEVSEWLANAIEEFDTVTPVNLINATSRNDIITGTESLSDTLSYQSGATKGVVVNLGLTYAQNTFGSGRDSITGIENLIGSEFNDTLRGDKNNNQLSGETGNDILVGGLGVDQLTGGAGRDKFVLTQAKDSGITFESMDTITDFVTGQDKIDLSIMDANTAMKGNNAFTGFIDATSTFTTAGQVKFDNGILYGNTDKDASAEFAIALTGITTLSVTDLIL